MTSGPQDYAMLVDRLRSLERQTRRMKLGLAALIVLLGGSVLLGASGGSKVLEVEGIVFKDAGGRVLGRIVAASSEGITQTMLDAKGNERVRLAVDAEGSARLRLLDDKQNIRIAAVATTDDHKTSPSIAAFTVSAPGFKRSGERMIDSTQILSEKDGTISQRFFDHEGMNRIAFSSAADKSAAIGVYTGEATSRGFNFGTTADNEVVENLLGADGKRVYINHYDKTGNFSQYICGKDEKIRINQNLTSSGLASTRLFGADGKSGIELVANEEGESGFNLFDKAGNARESFSIYKSNAAYHRVKDSNGKSRDVAYSDETGNVGRFLYDKEEKLVKSDDIETRTASKPVYTPPSSYAPPASSYKPNTSSLLGQQTPAKEQPREEQCLNCRGGGQVTCTDCRGTGKIACTKCNNDGEVKCTKCDANGMVSAGFFTSKKEVCKDCGGDKFATCPDCNGTKKAKCTGWISGCGGDGRVSCPKCFGAGRVTLKNGS